MSTVPKASWAVSTSFSQTPSSVRSPANTAVSPSISPAASSATSPSRSLISTLAPSRTKSSAVARPIPRAEPVMIALFPSSSPKFVASFVVGRGFLPKAVGGDSLGDDRLLGIGDRDLAEAEPATALGDARVRTEVAAVRRRGEVDGEGDRRARRVLGHLV